MHPDPQIQGHSELLFTSRVNQAVAYCQGSAGWLWILPLSMTVILSDLKGSLQNRIHLFGKEKKPSKQIDVVYMKIRHSGTVPINHLLFLRVNTQKSLWIGPSDYSFLSFLVKCNWYIISYSFRCTSQWFGIVLVTIFSTWLCGSASRRLLKKTTHYWSVSWHVGHSWQCLFNIYGALLVCWRLWWTKKKTPQKTKNKNPTKYHQDSLPEKLNSSGQKMRHQ